MHIADALREACVKSAVHETKVYVNLEGTGKYDYQLRDFFCENTVAVFVEGIPSVISNHLQKA